MTATKEQTKASPREAFEAACAECAELAVEIDGATEALVDAVGRYYRANVERTEAAHEAGIGQRRFRNLERALRWAVRVRLAPLKLTETVMATAAKEIREAGGFAPIDAAVVKGTEG